MSITITYNTDVLFNGIKFEQTSAGKYFKYSTNDRLYLTKDVTYEIKYRLFIEPNPIQDEQTSTAAAPFDLYVTASGGAKPFVDVDTLGYNVEVLSEPYNTFIEKRHLITPTSTGTGSLCLALKYGTYYISDIVVQPYSDVDTSVPEMRITIPMPPGVKRYEAISLYPIYIGGNNNPVGDVSLILSEGGQAGTYTLYQTVTGSNLVIANDDNLVAGSLYVGSSLRSGIEISGESSAMIRSVGYEGFLDGSPGFLFYSGSVFSGSGDNYRGVGVEINAGTGNGYIRMRSDDSGSYIDMDIESASFGYTYISGSDIVSASVEYIYISGSTYANGDIHITNLQDISGSLQHLVMDGDVVKIERIDWSEMYISASTTATTVTSDDTWYQVEGFSTGSNQGNITISASIFTVPDIGEYQLNWNASIVGTAQISTFQVGASANDGIPDAKSISERDFAANTDIGAMSGQTIIPLSGSNNVRLKIQRISGNGNPTFKWSNVILKKL